jgi:hypothetical protein
MLQFTCQKTHSGYKIPVITFFLWKLQANDEFFGKKDTALS